LPFSGEKLRLQARSQSSSARDAALEEERKDLRSWLDGGGHSWPNPMVPGTHDNTRDFLQRNFVLQLAQDFIEFAPMDKINMFTAVTDPASRHEMFAGIGKLMTQIAAWKDEKTGADVTE
jgi:hypothetical protein